MFLFKISPTPFQSRSCQNEDTRAAQTLQYHRYNPPPPPTPQTPLQCGVWGAGGGAGVPACGHHLLVFVFLFERNPAQVARVEPRGKDEPADMVLLSVGRRHGNDDESAVLGGGPESDISLHSRILTGARDGHTPSAT